MMNNSKKKIVMVNNRTVLSSKTIEQRNRSMEDQTIALLKEHLDFIMEKEGPYTVFLSGGMSNVPDYREKFEEAKQRLLSIGYTHIINPVDIDDSLPKEMKLEERFQHTSGAMKKCDAVYFMPGFENSTGATKEYHIALNMRKEIILNNNGILTLHRVIIRSANNASIIPIMTLE